MYSLASIFFFLIARSSMKVKVLVTQSCLTLCDPMDCSLPGSLSMGFSRKEYCSGLPFPSPEDLPNPGIKLGSPALQADSFSTELSGKPSAMLVSDCSMFSMLWGSPSQKSRGGSGGEMPHHSPAGPLIPSQVKWRMSEEVFRWSQRQPSSLMITTWKAVWEPPS